MKDKNDINLIFGKAVKYVQLGLAIKQYPDKPELTNDQKLKFYGLYKVATIGPNNTDKPGFFDFVGKSKWNAWTNESGKTKLQAKSDYIDLLNKLAPKWQIFLNSM